MPVTVVQKLSHFFTDLRHGKLNTSTFMGYFSFAFNLFLFQITFFPAYASLSCFTLFDNFDLRRWVFVGCMYDMTLR